MRPQSVIAMGVARGEEGLGLKPHSKCFYTIEIFYTTNFLSYLHSFYRGRLVRRPNQEIP